MRAGGQQANDLARHVSDIDIYHTSEDQAKYNNGLFWHTYHYVDAGKSTHRSYPKGTNRRWRPVVRAELPLGTDAALPHDRRRGVT